MRRGSVCAVALVLACTRLAAAEGAGVSLSRGGHQTLNLLTPSEHAPVSPRHLVTVYLAADVRRLNASLLRWFQEGLAAALGVPSRHVHIIRLNEQKNSIELFVASDRPENMEPRPAEEVIQSLNVKSLHRYLAHFGITEVASEKNVLDQKGVWGRDGFYTVLLLLTIFTIIITCLMVLYRLKEKGQLSDRQLKAPPLELHWTPVVTPHPAQRSEGTRVVASGAVVQSEVPPTLATPPPQLQPIRKCPRPALPGPAPSACPAPHPAVNATDPTQDTVTTATTSNDLKPCPSPLRMKSAGLQERRGSNVSLVLDMSSLGPMEPLGVATVTPRKAAHMDFLVSATRPITRQQLRDVARNTHALHTEFADIPMNFVDPDDLDIPRCHGTKNRYKTILPNPHSRVLLTSEDNDPLRSYINANYIRGYHGDQRAFIATQGPMVNTVNDFWLMAWQQATPAIVMVTKLKEKSEKCVLYWPEHRGIFGSVEVLLNNVTECKHYIHRKLTLKCGTQSRVLQHFWYRSWPDHKTPDSAGPLLELVNAVETARRSASHTGPVIVHCSAGIGRTGCFIATTIGCRQLQLEGVVDVLAIVCQLRADRGGMIQTCEQYEFVHHALCLYEARLSSSAGQ